MNDYGRYRRFFTLGALTAAFLPATLTGCGDAKKREARAVRPSDRCAICGMVVANYEGPKAELFLKEVDRAAVFCSLKEAFAFLLQPENRRRLEVLYVQTSQGDDRFYDASALRFVVGSRFEGVMGTEPAAFKTAAEAAAFIKKWGGREAAFDTVTLEDLA